MNHRLFLLPAIALALAGACGEVIVAPGTGGSGTTGTGGGTTSSNTTLTTSAGGSGGLGGSTTSSTASSSSSSSGEGGGPQCSSSADCGSGPCFEGICDVGVCEAAASPAGTPCPGGVCDGGGQCVECVTAGQCPSDTICVNNTCLPVCIDGLKDNVETDVDCGGSFCGPCANGKACVVGADCQSTGCLGGVCGELILISEVRTTGPAGDHFGDDFVELYNPGSNAVTFEASWALWYQTAQACAGKVLRYQGKGQLIPPHGHLLLVGLSYQGPVAGDDVFLNVDPTQSIADAASLWIEHGGQRVEALCFHYDAVTLGRLQGSCGPQVVYPCAGTPVSNLPHDGTGSATSSVDVSLERKPGGAFGNMQNTGDNAADFAAITPSGPQDLASPPAP